MKYLVTGVTGQLGYDVVKELRRRNIQDVIETNRENMDLTKEEIVKNFIKENKPDIVIHCAAYTNVELAEEDSKHCFLVNELGTKWLAEACKEVQAKLIYISSDYVFDGTKSGIYESNDITCPINVYGKSKMLGETQAQINPKTFIVRTSWVFGIHGKNFVKTMLRLAETRKKITVVNDQMGSPTYTVDLAKILIDISSSEKYGIYHVTNDGFCTWYEFAKKIFELKHSKIIVEPILSEDFPQKAMRPKNSCLSKAMLIQNDFEIPRNWEDALRDYLQELELYNEFI